MASDLRTVVAERDEARRKLEGANNRITNMERELDARSALVAEIENGISCGQIHGGFCRKLDGDVCWNCKLSDAERRADKAEKDIRDVSRAKLTAEAECTRLNNEALPALTWWRKRAEYLNTVLQSIALGALDDPETTQSVAESAVNNIDRLSSARLRKVLASVPQAKCTCGGAYLVGGVKNDINDFSGVRAVHRDGCALNKSKTAPVPPGICGLPPAASGVAADSTPTPSGAVGPSLESRRPVEASTVTSAPFCPKCGHPIKAHAAFVCGGGICELCALPDICVTWPPADEDEEPGNGQ